MSAAPAKRAAFSAGPGLTNARPGVGKWSRIFTYGVKRQQQDDGSWRTFELGDEAFAQALVNFKRQFAGRGKGMGSDYEHQTMYASQNGQPAPNLCYWGGMAWVKGDQVMGQEAIRAGVPPIDPAAERARLAEQNPAEDPDPSGLWLCCSEITELGAKIIPNYSQLSPLFHDHDTDETGADVGLAVQNASFVNVAFQGGTAFNFSKMSAHDDKVAKVMREFYAGTLKSSDGSSVTDEQQAKAIAESEARAAAASKDIKMNDMPPDMMGKLSKFGFLPDKPETAESAYAAYMEGTDDPAEERKKIAEMYKAMRAKMAAAQPQSDGPGSLPGGAPNAAPPELAAPGLMGKPPMVADADNDGMSKMAKTLAPILDPLKQRLTVAEQTATAATAELAAMKKKTHETALVAFRKEMLEGETARFLPEQGAALDRILDRVGGNIEAAREICEIIPPVAAFSRLTHGGNPIGTKSVPPPGISGMNKTQMGYAFNKAVRERRAKEPALSFAEAQKAVALEQPELYNGSL